MYILVSVKEYQSTFKTMKKLILIFCIFLTGCVSWRDNYVKPVNNFQTNNSNATLYLDLKASLKSMGMNAVSSESFSKDNVEKFLKIARNKGIFKEISPEYNNSDYILKINYEVENNGFAGISVATLGIIPGYNRSEQTMHVELRSTKNFKLLDDFTVTEKSSSWCHILLLFAMPFSNSTRETYESSYNDIVENVLARVALDISKQ